MIKRFFLSLSILFVLKSGVGCSEATGPTPLGDMAKTPMAPTITMISPVSGPVSGGTTVTISGTNFDANLQMIRVLFGNNVATVQSAGATTVVVTTPAGAVGMVDVVVTNGSSSLSATLTRSFTYPEPALTLIAGGIGSAGTLGGTGTAARFQYPKGVAADTGRLFSSDILYVSDGDVIRKVEVATGNVTLAAGYYFQTGSTDGTGPAARFNGPSGLVLNLAGSALYVADRNNHTIRDVALGGGGVVSTLAGTAGQIGSTDGTGAAARFYHPTGLARDVAGNLYVADTDNNTIRRVVVDTLLQTAVVTTLAGTAGQFGSTNGTGAAARFNGPSGIAVDRAGNLYVADKNNHTIRQVVVATGVVTTLAGTAGMSGFTDGTGAAARFNFPSDLAVDGAGNLYVASGCTIRKVVVATGSVTTLVGVNNQCGVLPGPLPARLTSPRGVAAKPSGALYLTDDYVVLGAS